MDWDILKRKLEKPYSRAYGLTAAQTLPLGSYGLCYCVGTVDCATHPSAGLSVLNSRGVFNDVHPY